MATRRRPPTQAEGVKRFKEGIQRVADVQSPVKMLVYSRNGIGKTTVAASFPKCLIIDIDEEGTRSVKHTGAFVRQVRRWEDIGFAYWYLKAGKHPFESVAIDTVTAMQEVCMRMVMNEAEDRDPNREHGMPDKRVYGRAGKLMAAQMLAFRNLPMNVVFLAQERVSVDDDTGEPYWHGPDLPNSSRGALLGCVGVTMRLYKREVKVKGRKKPLWEVRGLVGPHEEYETKDRTRELPHIVRNPTGAKIIEAWDSNPPVDDDEEEE